MRVKLGELQNKGQIKNREERGNSPKLLTGSRLPAPMPVEDSLPRQSTRGRPLK